MNKLAIFGVPRSGTSWLSQIFNSHPKVVCRYQPLFSYEHKGKISESSSTADIARFYEEILKTQDEFVLMTSGLHKHYPVFEKSDDISHIIFKETRYLNILENLLEQCGDLKIIGIIRNPLAVLASWVSAPKEFDPHWDLEKEWRDASQKNNNRGEEFYGFEKWKQASNYFLYLKDKYPNQFYLLKYSDLNKCTLATTKRMFNFCSLSLHQQTIKFIEDSKSIHHSDPYSVYRAKARDDVWKVTLPDAIISDVEKDLNNTPLADFIN